MARVIAVTFCVTLAASMAARLGSTPMAAFQICLQVWMTSSLLADGLAVAGQVHCLFLPTAFVFSKPNNYFCMSHPIIDSHSPSIYPLLNKLQAILASAFAEKDNSKATAAATRVLQVNQHLLMEKKNVHTF